MSDRVVIQKNPRKICSGKFVFTKSYTHQTHNFNYTLDQVGFPIINPFLLAKQYGSVFYLVSYYV